MWNDEFQGAANSAPDSTRWTYDLGGGGWGNGELETYTNSTANAFMDGGGHLVLSANYSGGNYSSARLKTQTLFDQAYGRVEASIMIPQGNGIWPAFWMLGSNIATAGWPACGEIDMMENIGQYNPANVIGGHIHGPVQPGGGDYYGGNGVGSNYTLPSGVFPGSYHLFAAEWSPTLITFYVDGAAYQTLSAASLPAGGTWVFNHPFFILLNLAVGGVAGTPDPATFPRQMLVDYVRVYKLTDNGSSPYGGTAATVPGTIQAENYDSYNDAADPGEPGEGFAYNGLGAGNTSGQYRTGDAVSIEACTDSGGGYDVDYTSPGQWLQYTLNVTQAGAYTLDARVASAEPGGSFHFDVDGNAVTGELVAPNTGGWQTWADVTAGPIALTTGRHVLLLVEDTLSSGGLGVCNFNDFTLTLASAPSPSVTPTPTLSRTLTPTDSPTTVPPPCAQWSTVGNAFAAGPGVTLTTAANNQVGAAWSQACLDLGGSFNMTFKAYFGVPGGADGLDFVLQADPRGLAALAGGGGNKGYSGAGGITPSVALDLETYNNNGTLQVLENGSATSSCAYAAGPCPMVFAANIANGQEHSYQVVWNAPAKTLTLIVDGSVAMVYNRDLVNAVFGGNGGCVSYGFTGATGGSNNLQYVYEVGCAVATASPTPSRSATPSPSPSASPVSSPSASGTPSGSPTPSAPATGTQTATPASSSPSFTATASPSTPATATPSPSSAASASATSTPGASATPTATVSATSPATATPSPTNAASASATSTPGASISPTATVSPWASASATPSPTSATSATATASASPTHAASATATASPSLTPTASASRTPSPSATPSAGAGPAKSPSPTAAADPSPAGGPVGQGADTLGACSPVPDPNPRLFKVLLLGDVDSLELRVYSPAMVLVGRSVHGPAPAGWLSLDLPQPFRDRAANGLYFYRISSLRRATQNPDPLVGRFLVLR